MVADFLFVLVGLAVVLAAGDLLVRGAVGLAARLKISALFISLSIVAFGTSAPELFVAIDAARSGAPGVAIGNIIGSNIANVLLVLGLPALVHPIAVRPGGLSAHAAAAIVATLLFAGVAYGLGRLGATTGAALVLSVFAYVLFLRLRERKDAVEKVLPDASAFASASLGQAAAFLVAGLIGLPLGAHLVVENASSIAAAFGVRETVIGLTVVAIGTSLPELATVFAAALHRKSDVAIGSVIGSNIFNILAVGGATGLAGGGAFDAASLRLELPVMIATTFLLAGFVFARRDIGRVSGALMLVAFAVFLALVVGAYGGAS